MHVLDHLLARAARQDAVLTWRDVAAAGASRALVRRHLRAGAWEPLLRGTHLVDPTRTGHLLQRSWARSAVAAVPGAVVGLGSAAALHDIAGVPRTGLVDVVVGGSVVAGSRRLAVHRLQLAAQDVVDAGGIPVTSAVRTLADLVPRLPRPDALAVLDSALRSGCVDVGGLAEAAHRAAGRRGCRAVQDLWGLADARAESPLESRARLRCVDAGLPPDELQLPVRDEHGHLSCAPTCRSAPGGADGPGCCCWRPTAAPSTTLPRPSTGTGGAPTRWSPSGTPWCGARGGTP
ncbi:type IV toxin-antitoxin system AbiEi family antitoxin domain-containing protein [Quadrisphaera sp. DSM 44207]|uniref:type IV toxin-antitoxin system AbiEi family antitoxin domain-containing protein n=1 Tax=Quadrisphaera sp. DSM 44207 TaxID=1881057 RepID=UPI000890D827|nr:type IV toxin-antitoxin system AbiEi family antitoxin domain-containing protein [Quadrisphaera sp. DSM 44207]SDQ10161.1 hypothetical protein SAMN05428996_0531 [Quadrisphaera sp. DSM 44207]